MPLIEKAVAAVTELGNGCTLAVHSLHKDLRYGSYECPSLEDQTGQWYKLFVSRFSHCLLELLCLLVLS